MPLEIVEVLALPARRIDKLSQSLPRTVDIGELKQVGQLHQLEVHEMLDDHLDDLQVNRAQLSDLGHWHLPSYERQDLLNQEVLLAQPGLLILTQGVPQDGHLIVSDERRSLQSDLAL